MKHEAEVIYLDGRITPGYEGLVERLSCEAAQGRLRVNLYRGMRGLGPEAYYTLADGTVLHEENGCTEDGTEYRVIRLVLN